MLSILMNPQFRTAQNTVLFNRVLSAYPSKSSFYLSTTKMISYLERNIHDIDLMMDIMKNEGEDEEIIKTIDDVKQHPNITTRSEVVNLTKVLTDFVKYKYVFKAKNSFITSVDMIDEDEMDMKNLEKTVQLARSIVNAYDVANISVAQHQFDTDQPESMKNVVAHAKDTSDGNKIVRTGIRALNSLLSPGYVNGSLYVYAALPANYKSGILLESHVDVLRYNDHLVQALNGKTPVSIYISMENNMSQTIKRLWSILYPNLDIRAYSTEEATEMFQSALTSNGCRSVILYYGYREKSTKDIEDIIKSFNTDNQQVVAVFLDYIKRIRPARVDNVVTSSEKSELHAIMNECKNIAVELDIPFITAHQLNRSGAQALDDAARGNAAQVRSDILLGRSNVSVAWEVMEVADWMGIINIDLIGDEKYLMIKAVKQRERDGSDQSTCLAYRHPFLSQLSFALKTDIDENVSLSIPMYSQLQQLNYQASGSSYDHNYAQSEKCAYDIIMMDPRFVSMINEKYKSKQK